MPAFLVASRTRGTFSLPTIFLELEELAACIKRDLATHRPPAETGRTQSGTLQRNEVKLMRGATGLTVLALKRALLLRAATCELASKCKQCVNE